MKVDTQMATQRSYRQECKTIDKKHLVRATQGREELHLTQFKGKSGWQELEVAALNDASALRKWTEMSVDV